MKKTLPIVVIVSALWLILSCSGDKGQMLKQLEALEQMNRADSAMRNDSLAESLAAYFDNHGTANERMRAHYILGRTYFDLGELPRALETYYEAADCADTTAADCDYKTLSRVHAQSAEVFNLQVQPRNELSELRKAEYFAMLACDTFAAIGFYSKQGNAYNILKMPDSAIFIKEQAAKCFVNIHREDRAVQTVIPIVDLLLNRNEISKAKEYIDRYDSSSGLFDENMNIKRGYEVYYYIKGTYMLALGKLDSAEYYFRKELCDGHDLNNQIGGCRGLMELYKKKKLSDSIAKYANLGYELNDSAYSLSEMENVQALQAAYNYSQAKHEADRNALKVVRLSNYILVLVVLFLIASIIVSLKYRQIRKHSLEFRLRDADITKRMHEMAKQNPPQQPNLEDWKQLRYLIHHEIPLFEKTLNSSDYQLTDMESDVCLLIRVHISPIEIAKLKKCSPSHISNIRKKLLLKVFNTEGGSEDFDDFIREIK